MVVSLLSCFAILMLPTMLDELTRRELAQLKRESSGEELLKKMKTVEAVDGKMKGVFSFDRIFSWIPAHVQKLVMGPVMGAG